MTPTRKMKGAEKKKYPFCENMKISFGTAAHFLLVSILASGQTRITAPFPLLSRSQAMGSLGTVARNTSRDKKQSCT